MRPVPAPFARVWAEAVRGNRKRRVMSRTISSIPRRRVSCAEVPVYVRLSFSSFLIIFLRNISLFHATQLCLDQFIEFLFVVLARFHGQDCTTHIAFFQGKVIGFAQVAKLVIKFYLLQGGFGRLLAV